MSYSSNKRAPYSTFRSDTKSPSMFPTAISNGNILNFTPPGFKHSLNVKFPDSRLAVCESCKRNFKTRDMCRVRNEHTGAPWTMAYICMTLDDSCLDEQGQYVDKPMICRMVEWQPFRVMRDFDKKTPVCATCKKTNRTRAFCRERHKHRQLPWCTVYVMLSTLDSADPTTVVAPSSKPIGASVSSDTEDSKPTAVEVSPSAEAPPAVLDTDSATKERLSSESPPLSAKDEASVAESKASDLSENLSPADTTKRLAELGVGDDINKIGESRTMLIKVSTVGTVITWLENGDDGHLARRNLPKGSEAKIEEFPMAGGPPEAADPGQQRNIYPWPMAMGMPHPNASAQYPYFHHPVQYVVPPGWQQYVHYPQHGHPQYEYHQGAPPPHRHPHQHPQHAPVQYLPIVQQSPIPHTPNSGPNTPVAAADSPAASGPSPAAITAGEAAAAQRLKRSIEEGASHERRVSHSPAMLSTEQYPHQHQPPPPPLPQLQHLHAMGQGLAPSLHLPSQGMAFHAPTHSVHVPPQPDESEETSQQHLQNHQDQGQQQQTQHHMAWVPYYNPIYNPQNIQTTHYHNVAAQANLPASPNDDAVHTEHVSQSGNAASLYHPVAASPSLGKNLPSTIGNQGENGSTCLDDEDNLNSSKRARLS